MTRPALKCPVCSSTRISIEGNFASFDNHALYKYMGDKGTFTRKHLKLGAVSARFCLECSYQMLFAKQEDVDKLAQAMSETKEA